MQSYCQNITPKAEPVSKENSCCRRGNELAVTSEPGESEHSQHSSAGGPKQSARALRYPYPPPARLCGPLSLYNLNDLESESESRMSDLILIVRTVNIALIAWRSSGSTW